MFDVTLHYTDGSESAQFRADSLDLTNDVATVDGVIHTNVQDVSIESV